MTLLHYIYGLISSNFSENEHFDIKETIIQYKDA